MGLGMSPVQEKAHSEWQAPSLHVFKAELQIKIYAFLIPLGLGKNNRCRVIDARIVTSISCTIKESERVKERDKCEGGRRGGAGQTLALF